MDKVILETDQIILDASVVLMIPFVDVVKVISLNKLTCLNLKAALLSDITAQALTVQYTVPAAGFIIPGSGVVTYTWSKLAQKTFKDEQPVLLNDDGPLGIFTLTVVTPAIMTAPAGPIPDPVPIKTGTFTIVTTQTFLFSD